MSWVDALQELYSNSDFDNDYLMHVGRSLLDGAPIGSGRYRYGSGERPYQRAYDLDSRYWQLKAKQPPISDVEIAKALGFYVTDRYGKPILDANGNPRGNTAKLRAQRSIANSLIRGDQRSRARELSETVDPDTGKLYTNKRIAELLNLSGESQVRNLLTNESTSINDQKTFNTAERLKELVGDSNYVDIGRGSEIALDNISRTRLNTAVELLVDQGYVVDEIYIAQRGNPQGFTIARVLCPPGTEIGEANRNRDRYRIVEDIDGKSELTKLGMKDPVRVELDRVKVRYAEEGGKDKDGVIEIRAIRDENGNLVAASPDLSLGNAKYAQVRIAVEGDKYIKGMAVYNENLPKGTDILVNSNKSIKDGIDGALKEMKRVKDSEGNDLGVNTENPFGATVWQGEYAPGKLSAINIVGDIYGVDKHVEGAWDGWSRNLPAQFLSKQSEPLIKQQLKLKVMEKQQEYEDILKITNPVVKQKLLQEFADNCDSAAVDLKAAPFGGQRVQVLLPLTTVKDNEIYAPNYAPGTTVALVRFPHAGPFEIPVVKVNNNNKEAQSFMKDAADAIGVSPKTAGILSGADFDGDTAIVIPMTRKNSQGEFETVVNIKGIGNGQDKLPGLDGFSPTEAYPPVYKKDIQGNIVKDSNGKPQYDMTVMTKTQKGREMGVVSNLITDMSLKGCDDADELARAVKYSMVVIDAEKHHLNYRQAEKDYGIKELKEKYQSNPDGSHGVSTLLSRAKSPTNVNERDPFRSSIDPETGAKIPRETGRTYEVKEKVKARDTETGRLIKDESGKQVYVTNPETGKPVYEKTGEVKVATSKSTRMADAKDASELLSDHPSNKELLYRDYANKMKSMANESRKEYLAVSSELKDYDVSPDARRHYEKEVASLDRKLLEAKTNAPRERLAQAVAGQIVKDQMSSNPDLDKEEIKRLNGQALTGARARTGAQKSRVTFSEEEVKAINDRAISKTKLNDLLKNADADNYKQMFMPKESRLSEGTIQRIEQMLAAGWTKDQIIDAGIASADTVERVRSGRYQVSA